MKDKTVLITGSSRGIGLAVAESFGALGANVAINCSKGDIELTSAKNRLLSAGINVIDVFGDISDYETCSSVVETVTGCFGDIDILVNNAGISLTGLFTDHTHREISNIIEVNQFSAINCCHIILPSMIHKKDGRIINISSIWGVAGASCEVIYSATKGFINTFTRALAKEVAPSGILINAIACGVIDTQMNSEFTDDEKEDLKNQIGLMRFGTPYDVAELCLYLAKTKYMTGQVLTLDGGLI